MASLTSEKRKEQYRRSQAKRRERIRQERVNKGYRYSNDIVNELKEIFLEPVNKWSDLEVKEYFKPLNRNVSGYYHVICFTMAASALVIKHLRDREKLLGWCSCGTKREVTHWHIIGKLDNWSSLRKELIDTCQPAIKGRRLTNTTKINCEKHLLHCMHYVNCRRCSRNPAFRKEEHRHSNCHGILTCPDKGEGRHCTAYMTQLKKIVQPKHQDDEKCTCSEFTNPAMVSAQYWKFTIERKNQLKNQFIDRYQQVYDEGQKKFEEDIERLYRRAQELA